MESRVILQMDQAASESEIILGTSPNAVKPQIYIAIITYSLVAIIKARMKSTLTTYEILQILSASLLDKTPLKVLLANQNNQDFKEQNDIQLKINLV